MCTYTIILLRIFSHLVCDQVPGVSWPLQSAILCVYCDCVSMWVKKGFVITTVFWWVLIFVIIILCQAVFS